MQNNIITTGDNTAVRQHDSGATESNYAGDGANTDFN